MLSNPKKHLFLIAFSTALAGFSAGSIVSFTDPSQASWVTFAFFYISLFLFSLGVFTLIGLSIRQAFVQKLFVINLSVSFRQALLLAILIVVSFLLLSYGLLFWWVELSLILFLAAVEGFLNLKV